MNLVLGPFRSGTSLVCALMAALGADFGPAASHYPRPDRLNPLGYFQLRRVGVANRALFSSAGVNLAAPPTPAELAATADLARLAAAIDPAGLPPWVKDPRLCLTLACWFEAGLLTPSATRILVVERDVGAAAKSVLGHSEVAPVCGGTLEGALAMTRALAAGARWHAALPGIESSRIAYEELLADPAAAIARLADWLGGASPARQRAALALIGKDAALRRHYWRKATRPGDNVVAAWKTLRAALR